MCNRLLLMRDTQTACLTTPAAAASVLRPSPTHWNAPMIEKLHRNAIIGLGALSLFIILEIAAIMGIATLAGIWLFDLIF